jgi:head-tail adaptor
MLRNGRDCRRYNRRIVLTKDIVSEDAYGHPVVTGTADALTVYASVERVSASRMMATFQQENAISVEVEFRAPDPATKWDGITWEGNRLHFAAPEYLDRGMTVRVTAWYQTDTPKAD